MASATKKTLPMIVALAMVVLFAATASANIYIDLQATRTSPDYNAALTSIITATQAERHFHSRRLRSIITPNGGSDGKPEH